MGIAKTILTVVYFIIAIAMIILALIQTKEDGGLSSTITGSSTNNFYEKNKGRTKEGKQKRWTIILAILFAILSIALGIFFASYILGIFSKLHDRLSGFIYLSPFDYAAPSNVIKNGFEEKYIIIGLGIMIISLAGTYIIYNKKDYNI